VIGRHVRLATMDPELPDRFPPNLGGSVRDFVPRIVLDIMTNEGDHCLGEVVLYNVDLTNGTGWLSIGFDPAHRRRAWAWEGVWLALDFAFTRLGLRQVYVEALEHLLAQFQRAADELMVEVGRLPDAWCWNGEYEDVVNFVIRRDAWVAYRAHFAPHMQAV